MRNLFLMVILGLLPAAVLAADLTVSIELPRLEVAEYHRPYVAVWLGHDDQSFAGNLAVWYNVKKKDNGGSKWLKDMRQWWRRSGRELTMPVDGVSGATQAAGAHVLTFSSAKAPLAGLAPGKYRLMVEAAREGGGRELVQLPFLWPPQKSGQVQLKGQHELGLITLGLKP